MLDRKDSLAANSRSTGLQQQNTDDQNCSNDSAERSTSADWQTADVDDQQHVGRRCAAVHQIQRNRSMKTSIHQHGELKLYSVGERRPERLKFKLIASLFKITAVINFPVRCINIICCVVVQRGGFLTTGNPCPVCRDEYLVLHPEVSSVLLLFQFNTESCC